jgi:transcriptional regulator with XRE-family HTH domain
LYIILTTMTAAQQIGTQIRAARETSGLSLRALAEKAEVSHSTIVAYEAGDSVPTADKLARLATELSIHFVEVDGFRLWISRVANGINPVSGTDQLNLEFNGEYAYSKASLKISPSRITVVFDAAKVPSPVSASSG